MAKLLYIEASPRKSRSKSIEVAHTFLSTFQSAHSSVEVDKLDLWSTELPRFDGDTLEAKYAIIHGQSHSPEQAKAWKRVEEVIERFKSADWYLFSLPMWNFGVPYVLKHFIGVTDVTSIFVEPTIAAPAEIEATITKAKELAVSTAKAW